jgi:uncharacterized RDD family membrane protein YckC
MSELSITTTQNVNINFTVASVGERALAYLLDLVIIGAYYTVVYYVVFNLMGVGDIVSGMDIWSQNAVQGVISLPVLFYALWQESLMEGQTIGKRIMKIKVIKIDGYQAGFGDYIIRWLLRVVEVLPPLSFIGLICMIINNKNQRLGDMAAGTAVITLKNDISINHTILKEVKDTYVPVYPLVIKLTDNDIRIIKETFEASVKTTDWQMIDKLQAKIEKVTGIKSVSANAMAFVDTVLHDYNYYTQRL